MIIAILAEELAEEETSDTWGKDEIPDDLDYPGKRCKVSIVIIVFLELHIGTYKFLPKDNLFVKLY